MLEAWRRCEQRSNRPARDEGLLGKAPAGPRWKATRGPRLRKLRWLFDGARAEPVQARLGAVEPPERGRLGICCSGGGIRSAAFSLGALQVLQRSGELRRAAYLAAVSGGSYIAAAISTVAKTGPEDSDPGLLSSEDAFVQGSPEEQYLRNRCSYLAPTTADKVYLSWRIVLGLAFNVVFIALPLAGVAVVLSGVFYAPEVSRLGGDCTDSECAANTPEWFWIVPVAVLVASALFGLATLLFRWRRGAWQRFFTIWSVRLLGVALVLALILLGIPNLVDLLDHLGDDGRSVQPSLPNAAPALLSVFLGLLSGVAAQLVHLLTSKEKKEGAAGLARKVLGKLGSGARVTLAYAAAAVFGPLLLLGLVTLAVALSMSQVGRGGEIDLAVVVVGLAMLVVFGLLYLCVDLTTWSLHPYYKRRLSSAFALKRVRPETLTCEERDRVEVEQPSEDRRGVVVERDFDQPVSLSETALTETEEDRTWPTLLVCAAANISDPGATPPGRPVTSFTFSAHAVGGPLVGAVPTEEMENAFATRRRRRDLTLMAAVAMSGAAISPSMGKMTRRSLTFLMALANVRLGVWVPNPRWVASLDDTGERRRYGRARPWYLLCELLGRNRIDARYLYVTDGGHYENLGLVELLRRGCTQIYCFDASGVGRGRAEFEALGEAIALARGELGVEIEFEEDPKCLAPDATTGLAEKDVVVGTISYPKGPTGRLVYARNTLTAEAPWDALGHHMADPRFPHNSTVDQLYTDQKFEAYRALGARAGVNAVEAMKAT
jgi:hypothetical protein